MPGRDVWARIWRIQVGRIPLYLLDTNIPANNPDDRQITARLYGGDHDMRVRQEMILGIGGYRALRAMGELVSTTGGSPFGPGRRSRMH